MADSGDGLFNLDSDSEDEDEEQNGGLAAYQSSAALFRSTPSSRRIKVGPPQNTDVRGRKIPPQIILQKIERIIHKVSMKLSVEMVSAPPCATMPHPEGSSMDVGSCSALLADSDDGGNGQTSAHRKKKMIHDAFDRLLGLNTKSANPVVRIASSYLGPLMRIIRVATFVVRISFHISTWRDPFLSFWVFVGLLIVLFVLIIFPWRNFFLLLVMGSVGPQVSESEVWQYLLLCHFLNSTLNFSCLSRQQNVFLRKYLEKKAEEKARESAEASQILPEDALPNSPLYESSDDINESNHSNMRGGRRRWPFGNGGLKKLGESSLHGISSSSDLVMEEPDRPAFRTELRGQSTTNRRTNPRAVTVPYSCLKKDRFFDWPPDPTVSRATPMPFTESARPSPRPHLETSDKVTSRTGSEATQDTSPTSTARVDTKDLPRGLRRRITAEHKKQTNSPGSLYGYE